ncbi:hypothetical protein IW261DRAFT_1340555, partial [Armillaria novae-zelandiae]
LSTWYAANESAIMSTATAISSLSLDTKSIDSALSSFVETSEVVMKGLDALGQLHPFVGVAVLAFKLVVTLDMTRRGNNKKVLAVKLQMQDTMTVLFQLRHIKDPKEIGPDGTTIEDRMGSLMEAIAKDIRETGSACDHYLKKGFLAKTIKSKIYETRLASYAAKFTQYQEDIDFALQIHTALGVESANAKLDGQDQKLKSMDRKLDHTMEIMMSVFRKLDTSRERDIQNFIKVKGGVKACIDNEQLLLELVDKSGEGIAGILGHQSGTVEKGVGTTAEKVQKEMRKEWAEDVDQAFERNIARFEKKLEVQNRQLTSIFKDSLKNTESHILTAMASGAHDRIVNEDLKELWKDMAWRGSVKAKHLVLALHDYLIDKLGALSASPMMSPSVSEPGSPMFSPISAVSVTGDFFTLKDRWALAYFNVAHVQPVLEAMDDDATGFITTKEINNFTKSIPPGWTLPQWIAYWAEGWHVSIDQYKKRIHIILSTMYSTFPNVLPANREATCDYLQHDSIYQVDRLLRSTRDLPSNAREISELRRLTEAYTQSEEARLQRNLADVSYDIDAKSTVSLITGPGRIERYIYPLLYLLLKHQLRVVRLSTKFVLDPYEMSNMSSSLWNLFSVVGQRMQNLASIFKQSNVDVVEKLENFAFGMFKLSYNSPDKLPSDNLISEYVNEDPTIDDEDAEPITSITPNILRYPLLNTSGSDMYHLPSDFTEEASGDPIQGQWTGHLYYERKSDLGLVQLVIDSVTNGALTGKAATWKWTMNISGDIKEGNKVYIRLAFEDGDFVDLTGDLDSEKGIIKGWCKYIRGSSDPESENYYYKFILRRTPASLCRFLPGDQRDLPVAEEEEAGSRARARWRFACTSVLDQMRRKSFSWKLLKDRFAERRQLLKLAVRERCVDENYSPRIPLSEEEQQELFRLKCIICPMDSRYYYSFVADEITRRKYTNYYCDSCTGQILHSRLACLTCMNDSFADTIDLCTGCIDTSCERSGFVHDPSHVLLKFDSVILDGRLRWIIPEARSMVLRIKNEFRSSLKNRIEPVEKSGSSHTSQSKKEAPTAAEPPKCRCCGKVVSLPCWVCLICAIDAYVCNECDAVRKEPMPGDPHQLGEPLLRIADCNPPVEVVATDLKLASLEKKFDKVDQRLATLEGRVESRLSAMETMLKEYFASSANGNLPKGSD